MPLFPASPTGATAAKQIQSKTARAGDKNSVFWITQTVQVNLPDVGVVAFSSTLQVCAAADPGGSGGPGPPCPQDFSF